MGGNYYNDFRCDLFDYARGFIDLCIKAATTTDNIPEQNINITNNITIINNTNEPKEVKLEQGIVFI